MPSTGPTTIAGPPSVIVQASLEREALRVAALTRLVPSPAPDSGRAALRPIPRRRFGRCPSGQ